MRRRTVLSLRAIAVLAMAFAAVFSFTASPASAQVVCAPNQILAAVDTNNDDIASISEIRTFLEENEAGTAELEDLLDRADAEGLTGFQYTGCTPETPEPTTAPTTGVTATVAPTADVTATATATTPDDGTDDGDDSTDGTADATDGTDATEDGTDATDDGDDSTDGGAGDDGTDDGVTELPETGQGPASDNSSELVLLLGAASAMMLAGGVAWQRRRIA